jgi:hypothetical protein
MAAGQATGGGGGCVWGIARRFDGVSIAYTPKYAQKLAEVAVVGS